MIGLFGFGLIGGMGARVPIRYFIFSSRAAEKHIGIGNRRMERALEYEVAGAAGSPMLSGTLFLLLLVSDCGVTAEWTAALSFDYRKPLPL